MYFKYLQQVRNFSVSKRKEIKESFNHYAKQYNSKQKAVTSVLVNNYLLVKCRRDQKRLCLSSTLW